MSESQGVKGNEPLILQTALGDKFFDMTFEEHMKQRKIILNGEIDSGIVETISLQILKWNEEDENIIIEKRKPIKIFINSEGGDAFAGFNAIDVIKNSKTPIIGIVMGYAYSMGGLILLACHKRYGFKHSTVLIHDGSASAGGSGRKFQDISKFYEKLNNRMKEYILENTTMDEKFYDDMVDRELYMFADEAKEHGIIDGIIGIDIEKV